ncbi:MAG: DUF192 domain-containing protein [Candidatus Aminicenantales bacterium]
MKKNIVFSMALLTLFCSGQTGKDKFIKVFFPDGFSVTAELAVTVEARARGLMFREEIQEDQAMLFLFEDEDIHSFWMKNMRFSIDILWLDRERRIVHLEASVPPCLREPCPSYAPGAPAAYVLELRSGSAEKHGLSESDRLEFILPRELSGFRSQRP